MEFRNFGSFNKLYTLESELKLELWKFGINVNKMILIIAIFNFGILDSEGTKHPILNWKVTKHIRNYNLICEPNFVELICSKFKVWRKVFKSAKPKVIRDSGESALLFIFIFLFIIPKLQS